MNRNQHRLSGMEMSSHRPSIASVLALGLLQLAQTVQALDAFQGALGQGAVSTGGRGGDVYHVISLADYSKSEAAIPGTLRYAVESASGPRTIVFDVGGAIQLARPLSIKKSDLTLAGQTAPGGITLWAYPTSVSGCSNVIVRYMRFRTGDFNAQTANPDGSPASPVSGKGNMDLLGDNADGISILSNTRNIIFDHLSASWSMDETMSVSGVNIRNVTIQNSIIAESLNNSFHYKGVHGYGSLIRADLTSTEQTNGVDGLTLYGNLWVNHAARNPAFGGQQNLDPGQAEAERRKLDVNFVNNVICNWGNQPTHRVADGKVRVNYVNNYIIAGPSTPSGKEKRAFAESTNETTLLYQSGNFVDWDRDSEANATAIDAAAGSGSTESFSISSAADMLAVAFMGESSSVANQPFPRLYWNDDERLTLQAAATAGSDVVLIYILENPTRTTASIRWESDQSEGVMYLVAQTMSLAAGLETRAASDSAVAAPFEMLLDYGELGAGSFIFEAVVGNNNNSLPVRSALLSDQTAVATDQNNQGSWSGLVSNESLLGDSADEQNATGFNEAAGDPDRLCNAGIAFVVRPGGSTQVTVANLVLPDGFTHAAYYSLPDIPPGHPELIPIGTAFVNFDASEFVIEPHNFFNSVSNSVLPAEQAYERVVASAGASLTRDAMDQRLISSVSNRTGAIINSQEELRMAGVLPGIDDLPTQVRPAGYDSDQDGISDEFEIAHGLDPNDPADRNGTELSADGHTNLERFLDSLTGVDVPTPYESWIRDSSPTGAETAFDADPNHDGVLNGEAFLYGSVSPLEDATALRPTAKVENGRFCYEFRRRSHSGVLALAEYSTTLDSWTPVEDGVDGIQVAVSEGFYSTGTDKVTVSMPTSWRSKRTFLRLRFGVP